MTQPTNVHTQGSRSLKLQHKILNVKKQFIEWNKRVFGKVEKEIKNQQQMLQEIQNSIQTIADLRRERELREELENLMIREEITRAQKARSDWIVQGDRNTKYFQIVVKQRRARSRILHLKIVDGNTTKDLKVI